jgi:hypothetical protein
LPNGKVKADVMILVAPPRASELGAKMLAAVQKNQQWFLAYVRSATPGEPLPYDPRLGMTSQEYAEYLRLLSQTTLRKSGETELVFKRTPNGRITIAPSAGLADMAGIVIDTRLDTVETPYGRAEHHSEIVASKDQQATGPWNGIRWACQKTSPTGTTNMNFALGRRTEDDRAILYYTANRLEPGVKPQQVSRIVIFAFAR